MLVKFIKFILEVFGVGFCIIVAFDVWMWLKVKMSHKRIKAFANDEDWKIKVIECAKKWAKRMPIIPLKDNSRFVLLDILRKQYKASSVQGWQYAELLGGIYSVDSEYRKKSSFLIRHGVKEIDEGSVIYQEWNNGVLSENQLEDIMKKYLKIVNERTRKNGLIEYRDGFGDICIADTIGFVCPILIKWGRYINDYGLIETAIRQIDTYHKYGYIPQQGLYAHGYNSVTGLISESVGWGRGTGWYLLGILYSYKELINTIYEKKIKNYMLEAADNIIKLQMSDGGWCTQLVGQWNYDSSATAIFGYYLSELCYIEPNEKYFRIAKKAFDKLKSVTRKDGAIEYCEGDCHGIGKYSKIYSISPFTQGMTLKLVSSLSKIKKEDNAM